MKPGIYVFHTGGKIGKPAQYCAQVRRNGKFGRPACAKTRDAAVRKALKAKR